MKLLIYFILLVALWVTFIPALNSLRVASNSLVYWFICINLVVSVKLIIDIHTSQHTRGERGPRGRSYNE